MNFKRFFVFAMCVVMVLSFAACGSQKTTDSNAGGNRPPSPFIPCDNMAEAAELAGFDMTVSNPPDSIEAWDGYMIQAFYGEDGEDMLIRKATGNDDISGDYNEYPQVETVDGVTLKGENEKFALAVWSKDGYTYSVSVGEMVSQSDMLALIAEVR